MRSRDLFVAGCILLLVAMFGWRMTESWREKKAKQNIFNTTSDAAKIKHRIKIGGDEWLGYLIFRSPHFRRQLENKGIAAEFQMEPDFQKRFALLDSGECDFVCATIDSYLLNGNSINYPGVIVFGIDESFGGDALVGGPGVETLDDLKMEATTGAMVGYSPSEFLLKSQIAHFGLDGLTARIPSLRTDSAEAAFSKLKSGQANFAVLWEPYVSKALKEIPSSKRLMDTRQARGIIYDVAIASRKTVAKEPQLVQDVTNAYFTSLNHYLSQVSEFEALAKSDSGESLENARTMLAGIRFLNVLDNRDMVNGGNNATRMTDAVSNISRILVNVGDLATDPFNGNPHIIVNSSYIDNAPKTGQIAGQKNVQPIKSYFRQLNQSELAGIEKAVTGTLIEKPITFGVGQSTIPEEFQADLKEAAQNLVHYPRHRVIVQAHVSPGSDADADRQLSQERADVIRNYFITDAGISENRVVAVGKGGDLPLERASGESLNAWKRKCRRAKIFIAVDD